MYYIYKAMIHARDGETCPRVGTVERGEKL